MPRNQEYWEQKLDKALCRGRELEVWLRSERERHPQTHPKRRIKRHWSKKLWDRECCMWDRQQRMLAKGIYQLKKIRKQAAYFQEQLDLCRSKTRYEQMLKGDL